MAEETAVQEDVEAPVCCASCRYWDSPPEKFLDKRPGTCLRFPQSISKDMGETCGEHKFPEPDEDVLALQVADWDDVDRGVRGRLRNAGLKSLGDIMLVGRLGALHMARLTANDVRQIETAFRKIGAEW